MKEILADLEQERELRKRQDKKNNNKRGRTMTKRSEKRHKTSTMKRESVTCEMCVKYPCFKGIETLNSNLAETCRSLKTRK